MFKLLKNSLRWIRVLLAGLEAGVNEYEKGETETKLTDSTKE